MRKTAAGKRKGEGIDFDRLFKLKDKLASHGADGALPGDPTEQGRGESPREIPTGAPATVAPSEGAIVFEFPSGPAGARLETPSTPPPPITQLRPPALPKPEPERGSIADRATSPETFDVAFPPSPTTIRPGPISETPAHPAATPEPRPPSPAHEPSSRPRPEPAASPDTFRLGLTRPLHERLRAAAALACVPPTAMARDVLASATPAFDTALSISELVPVARAAFPQVPLGTRRVVEVRMQLPMNDELHRRLLQLAALRAQTLSACLLDLLEHQLPR